MRSVTDMGVVVHQMASAVMAHRSALEQVSTQQAALQKAAAEAANVRRGTFGGWDERVRKS